MSVAEPTTSARSSALRRSSGGRVSMSHAWLIACRSARDVVEHHLHDPVAELLIVEEEAEAADEQHRERNERKHREERDLRSVAVPSVVHELHARPSEREQASINDASRPHISA